MSEHHEQQFRGCWLKPEVMQMVADKTISCKEAILLMVIDSLCKLEKGCIASNKYLGKQIHAGNRGTQVMLAHLKELGLVWQIKFDGRQRRLATEWLKTTRQTCRKLHSRHDENCIHIKNNKKEHTPETDFEIRKRKKEHPRWEKYANNLHDAINSVRQVNCNSSLLAWTNSFSLLHIDNEVSISRIRDVLKWYCVQIRKGDLITNGNPNYLPIAYTGKEFRDKFGRIEATMEKMHKPAKVKDGKVPEPDIYNPAKLRPEKWPLRVENEHTLEIESFTRDEWFKKCPERFNSRGELIQLDICMNPINS